MGSFGSYGPAIKDSDFGTGIAVGSNGTLLLHNVLRSSFWCHTHKHSKTNCNSLAITLASNTRGTAVMLSVVKCLTVAAFDDRTWRHT